MVILFVFLCPISSWPHEALPINDTCKLIDVLCHDENIHHVTVNSTLGKHYISKTERLCFGQSEDSSNTYLISGDERGKALIICTKERRGDWEIQHKDVVVVLEKHLGLKVVRFPMLYNTEYHKSKQNIITFCLY